MLCHLELLMIKGISYTWSSVRSFHAHITKQVELYCLEWSNTSEIRDRANTFLSTWIYAKHQLLVRHPRQPLHCAGNRTRFKTLGAVNLGIILAVVPVKRKRSLILASTSATFANRITQCFTAPNTGILFLQHFDTAFHHHTLLPLIWPRTYQWTMMYRKLAHAQKLLLTVLFVPWLKALLATSAIICQILASRSDQPNTLGDKIPVPTALKVCIWAHVLCHYDDKIVAEFLKYGWRINYSSHQFPLSTPHSHQSALTLKCPLGQLLDLFRATHSTSLLSALHFKLFQNAVRQNAESSWTWVFPQTVL